MKKQIKSRVKRDVEEYELNIVKDILTTTGSFKQIRDKLSEGKQWIPSLAETTSYKFARTEIMSIATEFYKNLYTSQNYNSGISSLNQNDFYNCEINPDNSEYIDSVLPFTISEIRQSISDLCNDKCYDNSGIKAEYLKYGEDAITCELKKLFNEILDKEILPQQWLNSSIILLHKKGDTKDINNYRPISIISVIYKIFAKCLNRRMAVNINENQPREQAGFRSGYSTADHLHTINQVIEKSLEYNIRIYFAFIDFKKAFDSIEHQAIWKALKNQGIQKKYISILKNLYDNSYAHIKLERSGPPFKLNRGVRQGDPLSPQLFSAVLEDNFRQLEWSDYGLNLCGQKLNNLRFADDIVLISNDPIELQIMINELNEKCHQSGLEMNMSKTVLMTNAEEVPITINDHPIQYVEDFTYLGQIVSFNSRLEKEITRRITNAWKQFWSLRKLIKVNLKNEVIKYIFDTGILPVLTYGSQTWSLTRKLKDNLQVCQRSMERSILGISRRQRLRNTVIRSKTKITDVIYKASCLKWSWAGHVMRLNDERWTKLATEWCPMENLRNIGRQRTRWRDDLNSYCNNWSQRALNRSEWKQLEEAYAQSNQT